MDALRHGRLLLGTNKPERYRTHVQPLAVYIRQVVDALVVALLLVDQLHIQQEARQVKWRTVDQNQQSNDQ